MFSFLNELSNTASFRIRKGKFGEIQFREGLPKAVEDNVNKKECSFYQLLLSKGLESSLQADVIIDVGCRNWSYVKGLWQAYPTAELLGVEVDGNRRYLNLYRRKDLALSYTKALKDFVSNQGRFVEPKVECVFKDFRDVFFEPFLEKRVVVCFFFPFVSKRPCLKWGLPVSFAKFDELVAHCLKLPKLTILSAHQGDWEYECAEKVYQKFGFKPKPIILPTKDFSELWPGRHDIYLVNVSKSL